MHTVTEIDDAFQQVENAWEHTSLDVRPSKLGILRVLLEELWNMSEPEALNLRRRIRAFIDAGKQAKPSDMSP